MVLLPAILLACSGDTTDAPRPPGSTEDTNTPGVTSTADTGCTGDPDVTWQGWGRGFMATYCDGCHAADTASRHGAPKEVSFDTLEEVREQAERIHIRTLDEQDMPPGGGVLVDDLWLLEVFLRCGL